MSQLTGRVLYPDDPGWDLARRNFNRRFDVEPHAVVFCQEAEDVVNAVDWARSRDLPFRVRSGRHSYEGYSLVEGGLIIDVSDMNQISIDRKRQTARIGAGAYMLQCSEKLSMAGFTLPLAAGPTVGIAGLTLGGGVGLTSRRFGLTCDNLLSLEMVTAGGELLEVTPDSHPDLFWASQGGGGGNFGIATSFTFKIHTVDLVAAFSLEWQWDAFEAVVARWQHWAPQVNAGLTSVLQLNADRQIQLYGIYVPETPADLQNVMDLLCPMLQLGPSATTIRTLPYQLAARMFFVQGEQTVDVEEPEWPVHSHAGQQIYKSTSAVAGEPFGAEAIATMKAALENVPPLSVRPSQPSMVQLLPGGGAITAVHADDTAVLWRDIAFIVQYDAYWTAPQDAEPTINWVDGFREGMLPFTEGAYVNYVDERLNDPLRAYYGEHLERLVEVKRKYDPENVFHFPQSVPTDLDNLAETQEDGAGDDKSDGTQDTGDGAGLRLTSRVYDC